MKRDITIDGVVTTVILCGSDHPEARGVTCDLDYDHRGSPHYSYALDENWDGENWSEAERQASGPAGAPVPASRLPIGRPS